MEGKKTKNLYLEDAFTGLEAASVLIAFVVVAAVLYSVQGSLHLILPRQRSIPVYPRQVPVWNW